MYFRMITSNGQVYFSKDIKGTAEELGTAIGELATKGGSFQLNTEEYIMFSKKVGETAIFILTEE